MIYDEFISEKVSPSVLDSLLFTGFRHFGVHFFRYDHAYLNNEIDEIIPLRICLGNFVFSNSQKKILKKNKDVEVLIRETSIDFEKERLFSMHKERFSENKPASLYTFLSENPSSVPCENKEIALLIDGKLAAVSFLDIGENSTSSVYAIFDPLFSKRSLGILTMLEEIRFSIELGKKYYYHGYVFQKPSFYDYKKNFSALEYYDWKGGWFSLD